MEPSRDMRPWVASDLPIERAKAIIGGAEEATWGTPVEMSMKNFVSVSLFFLSALFLTFLGGMAVAHFKMFPYTTIRDGYKIADSFLSEDAAWQWYYFPTTRGANDLEIDDAKISDALTLVASVLADDRLAVRVVDRAGNDVHKWDLDVFAMWPNLGHLPENKVPKSRPGTHIHGMALLDDGDLVFNFNNIGLVRVGPCGEVRWRLAYPTHHSVFAAEDGNLWVSGRLFREEPDPRFPNYVPPFNEETVLVVSPDGKLLREYSIMEILIRNGMSGWLYMGTLDNDTTRISGDTMHLNDVEVFPSTMRPGVFETGDVMVSLRNINAVFVFDPDSQEIKFFTAGKFVRQHDPDFIDGNTISVFDNNNISDQDQNPSSRIVLISALDDQPRTIFSGTPDNPFYSNIMGNNQWLPNGHLLLAESMKGRVIEVDGEGSVVWEYINVVGKGMAGIVEEAQRPDARQDRRFFHDLARSCETG
jgi:hypothetical protein